MAKRGVFSGLEHTSCMLAGGAWDCAEPPGMVGMPWGAVGWLLSSEGSSLALCVKAKFLVPWIFGYTPNREKSSGRALSMIRGLAFGCVS